MGDSGIFTGVGAAPRVLGASVIADRVVRVSFDGPMLEDAYLSAIGSYVFSILVRGSTPVSAQVVTVPGGGSPTYVDVTVDASFTVGSGNYRVTVSTSVKDQAGNGIDAGYRTADFDGIGGQTVGVTLTGVAQSRISADGGYPLDLSGIFTLGDDYRVYVGSSGSTADAICFSGVAGRATTIHAISSSRMRVFSPRLPVGGPFAITLYHVASEELTVLADVLYVSEPDRKSAVYALRSYLPPIYATGVRLVDSLPTIKGV